LKENSRFKKFEIGEYSYGTPRVLEFATKKTLKIGKFCSIATGVVIVLGGNHRTDWVTTYPFSETFPEGKHFKNGEQSRGDVVIGNDVWLSTDAMILSGVTIGDGAVVAARSVVRSDVPPYAIVGGVPARIVRYRFNEEKIAALLRVRWGIGRSSKFKRLGHSC
jgi:acetyltransferase-like isoleucine patch superfamily enzyme